MNNIQPLGSPMIGARKGDHGQRDNAPPRNLPTKAGDPVKALISAIAMDIGKEVVAYLDVMYPKAAKACSSTFRLSVRNCIYNEIMAAIEINDEGQIIARLRDRKTFRRKWTPAWRNIRKVASETTGG
jgi:hypothetical protein